MFSLFWLAVEYWWVLAAIAAIAIGAALWAGFVSVAKIIAALLKAAAAVAEFFVTPREQIAAKALCVIACVAVGAFCGWWKGSADTEEEWRQKVAAAEVAFQWRLNEARRKADEESARRAEADADEIAKLKEAFDALESRTRDAACLDHGDNDGLRKLWSPRRR
jgi:hypothetical protein